MKKTRNITYTAICSAITVALLYVASVMPTGQLGFTAATVFAALAASYYGGTISSLLVYLISGALAFLIIPEKSQCFIYALFFGYYPVLKLVTDEMPYMASISIKLVAVNISLIFIRLILSEVIMGFSVFKFLNSSLWLFHILLSAVFVIFDKGVGLAWRYLKSRLPKKI